MSELTPEADTWGMRTGEPSTSRQGGTQENYTMAPIAPPSGWRCQAALGLAQRTYVVRSRSSSPLGQPVKGPGRIEPTCLPWHLR
jgi:hypothetical protein